MIKEAWRTKKLPDSGSNLGVDFAWKTHSAITDWTAKVDSKSAIVLSLGGVLLGFLVTLSANDRLFTHLVGWRIWTRNVGILIYCLGILFAALVVLPRLNRKVSKKDWKDNFVYFGHLRKWKPKDLAKKLQDLDEKEAIHVLSLQLVSTAKIAWYKHRLLQVSMFSYFVGIVLLALSVIWPK